MLFNRNGNRSGYKGIYNEGKNEIWTPSFTLPQYGCAVIDYVDDSSYIAPHVKGCV